MCKKQINDLTEFFVRVRLSMLALAPKHRRTEDSKNESGAHEAFFVKLDSFGDYLYA
ncbi:MAG: hypothetical protein ACQEXQ_01170 [Bacillota bacterium]